MGKDNLIKEENSELNIAETIKSVVFQEEIKSVIESCKGTDWGYNGEDEFEYDIFYEDEAVEKIINLLKKHFLKEKL